MSVGRGHAADEAGPILVYDGDCAFCAHSVRFILARDTRRRDVRFAARESPARRAVRERHPDVRAVVELGGHDAKMLVFEEHAGITRTPVSMNDKCAGGTGTVIDKLAAKLRIPPAAMADLGYLGEQIYTSVKRKALGVRGEGLMCI